MVKVQQKPGQAAVTQLSISRKRLRVFKLIAVLLPFVLLGLLEGALRLFGYGQDYRLFVTDAKDDGYWVMNRHVSEKYFTTAGNATIGNEEKFQKIKAGNTFRVFVLGESTTIGYPYLHNGSFHRWLHYRLMHTFPEKNFEIINVSLTAVNSYTVLDFAGQVVNYQPDVVLIYTGHNEYYGALGVGSTSFIGGNPAVVRLMLWLRELRLVQWLTNTYAKTRQSLPGTPVDGRETLMKRMAAKQQIPYQSETYQRGIRQYEINLNDALEVLHERQIPVFVSNVVSNEKDLKPFISDTSNAAASAIHQYKLANEAYEKGDFIRAKKRFVQAKELDLLRFRAPEAINTVIWKLTDRYDNVHLVDAHAQFEKHSPHGIIGEETLLEHVHPNLFGYAVLSDAFYEAMKKQRLIADQWTSEMPFAQLRSAMPITQVDSLRGAYEIMMLKEGWPFNEPMPAETVSTKTVEEKLAGGLAVKQLSWGEAMTQLMNYYLQTKNQPEALRVTEALLLEYPYDPAFYAQAGKLCMNLNESAQAVFYLEKAFGLKNDFETAKSLFVTLLKADQPEAALPYLNYAAAHNPSGFSLNGLQALVNQLITLKAVYAKDSTNIQVMNQIAATYLQFANGTAADVYVKKILQAEPQNAEAIRMQAQIAELK